MRRLGLMALVLAMIMMVAVPVYADDDEIDCDDDPGALAAALATVASGAILEIEGRCVGTFLIDEDLTLQGDDDAVLDGDGAGPVVTVEADVTVVLEDLKITGGTASGPLAVGGIFNNGDLTLRDVTVAGNRADATGFFLFDVWMLTFAVGGIHNELGASLTLEDSTVRGNTAIATAEEPGPEGSSWAVGGVQNSGAATFDLVTVRENASVAVGIGGRYSESYGGILSHDGSLTLNGSTVRGNSAAATDGPFAIAGAGIANFRSPMSLTDTKVTANSAIADTAEGDGYAVGGVLNEFTNFFGSLVTLTNSVVSRNRVSATFAAGGIEVYYGDMTVENTVVAENEAVSDFWAVGGIDNVEGSMFTLTGGKVTKNTADGPGVGDVRVGGVRSDPDLIDIAGTTIRKNLPTDCSFPDDACGTWAFETSPTTAGRVDTQTNRHSAPLTPLSGGQSD